MILGIIVPLVIIIILLTLLLLSLPLMVILILYNVFGNCRNVIDKTLVDNEEYADKDIEDLPPEIDSIENTIFSCDPHLTLKKTQVTSKRMSYIFYVVFLFRWTWHLQEYWI